MDYGKLPMFVNMNDRFLSAKYDSVSGKDTIWELWAGQYNMFFGQYKPYWLTFISNTDPTTDKVFNNLSWRTFDYNSNGILHHMTEEEQEYFKRRARLDDNNNPPVVIDKDGNYIYDYEEEEDIC